MRILKFGGSSVGNASRISNVIKILNGLNSRNESFSVVFSAFQGVTDDLIKLTETASKNDSAFLSVFQNIRLKHFNIINELFPNNAETVKFKTSELLDNLQQIIQSINILKYSTPRILDSVLSFGEKLSCTIIAEALIAQGLKCEFLDAGKLIRTDESFGHGKVLFDETNENIKNYFGEHKLPQIITGFIASSQSGEITTLGRGGSDYTASIFGAALQVEEIEIWTDVDGIMTADPRQVSSAIPLKAVTYQEAMEMSYFGAKVIHPPTMQPAFEKHIRLRIKNTFHPEFPGTVIREREAHVKFNAKGISSIDNVSMFRIEGRGMQSGSNNLTARIFEKLAQENIPVLFISQGSSGLSLCIAILPSFVKKAEKAIRTELRLDFIDGEISDIVIENDLALMAVVGEDMRATPGVSGKIFNSLGKNNINIKAIAQGSSELNVSFVIKNDDLKKALNVIHNAMFLSHKKIINIFLAGPGLVGKALIEYIKDKTEFLNSELSTQIRFLGITNSKKILFNEKGINIDRWNSALSSSEQNSNPENFVDEMFQMNRANSIFVDCTATDKFIPFYEKILQNSIPVVTPNKIANTGKIEDYYKLKATAAKHNTQFLYATNVGAALPVISTIQQLVESGEKVEKIEAILSGSLSYIFNEFSGAKKLSEIIRTAQKLGYTEPDPRDDLSGLDTARKILILIRESGLKFELSDINIENLVPEEARTGTVDNFFLIMQKYDQLFGIKKFDAEKAGKKLKYIASFENSEASVGIKEIASSHPFYSLTGTENIVAITTANHDTPLVLRGKGAGASYTAYGVFADIIKITKYLG